jgi:hypothetical protein
MPENGGNMLKRLRYFMLFLTLAVPLRASPPMGAMVQNSHYDPIKRTMTFSVVNVSRKDITAFSLQLRETFADGTEATSEFTLDFLPGMISTIEQGHEIEPGGGNGAFAPGATRNTQEFSQSPGGQKLSATVDMVAYADGSTDVLNERSFRALVLRRKGDVLAMRKVDELLRAALADPKVDHPSVTVAAQLKGLAVALQNKTLSADNPEDYVGSGFVDAIQDISHAPTIPGGRSGKEDGYLLTLIRTHENRISLLLPHTQLTKGVQP